MSERIRVLILEDSAADAELIERELTRGGLAVIVLHVSVRDTYERALDEFRPHLILSDYNLPGFDGIAALMLARKRGHEVPFILVSGAIGEELAVEALKFGATDYVLKGRLERLVPSVQRALREAAEQDRRLRAEDALRTIEERLRRSVESMLDAFGIYTAVRDEGGHIVDFRVEYVNDAMSTLSGVPTDSQISRLLLETFPDVRASGLFDDFVRVIETGAPLTKEALVRDVTGPVGSGATRSVDLRAVKLEDGVAVSGRDVTERARAERALRASEERFRVLLDNAPYAVVVVDLAGRIVLVNPRVREVFGYELSEVVGETLGMLVPEALRSVHDRHQRDYIREASPRPLGHGRNLSARHRDGRIFPAEISLTPVRNSDGEPLVMATVVDVSERHAAEQARIAQETAEAANRSKSEFLSRMSHELRTPLNAVLGFGQLLEIEELSDAQRDSVAHILKGGRHLLDLINEVLDISRIESGDLTMSPEPVLAADLVQEAVDLIRPLADQRGIQLVVDGSDGCNCYMFADRQRVKQVLLNLLSNAVKYNRARGTISISCDQPSDTRMSISVSDTGMGIPAERLGLLFTPFERLGAEQTGEEGTGIGLALSKRLAEAMGGTLVAASALGRGSTFTVDLPRVEGPVERYERLNGATQPPAQPAVPRRVVLHIEDNLSNLNLVERVLAQRAGIQIVAAMHGGLGLELAREHHPVLVLLDLHLPDMGGEQVLQRLRDDPATASIPVVIVSADATPGNVQRLLSAGAVAYLTKPIDIRELLRLLDEALTGR